MSAKSVFLMFVVLLATCGDSTYCRGGSGRHDRPAEKYSELSRASDFQSVGEVIRPLTPGSNFTPSGSAVLVAPQWALTAGHVAADAGLQNHRYRFGGEDYRVVHRVLRPSSAVAEGADSRLSGMAAGEDVALVKLDRPVKKVQPATRYGGGDEVGRTMTKVGYGCIADGLAGTASPLRQSRRAGHNVVDAAGAQLGELTVSEHVLLCDFDRPDDPALNRLGEPEPLDLEIGLSVGDSGGGWFIQDRGSWKLVAITSGHLPPKGDPRERSRPDRYGTILAGMRISTMNEWIEGVIGGPALNEQ